ncbi:hypothetical protein [Caldimonas mangrovi]|uniref:hypothetical protein n=1 Tax=Caldimonas mangrovi TaxID=2944811 RepID=UPI00387EC613
MFESTVDRHSFFEDAQALVTGTLFISLGVAMYNTAGLAFLLHYASGMSFDKAWRCICRRPADGGPARCRWWWTA